MSDDRTFADDRDDAAFRARLAPLASEVLPGGGASPPGSGTEGAAGPAARRLIARAGTAAVAALPERQPRSEADAQAVPHPNARAHRRFVVASGLAVAGAVAGAAWSYLGPSGIIGVPDRAISLLDLDISPSSATSNVLGPDISAPHATTSASVGVPGPGSVTRPPHAPGPVTGASGPESETPGPITAVSRPAGQAPGPQAPGPVTGASGKAVAVAGADPASPTGEPVEAMVVLLMHRGDAALADGDIMAARLLFERAAALGSAAAATAAGKTYDIDFLSRAGAHGTRADPKAAAVWYRKAAALGDPEARARLAGVQAQSRP